MASSTQNRRRPRPLGVWALVVSTGFLSITALFGGLNLVRDPTGGGVDLVIPVDSSHLAGTPFADYTIPGLVLFVFLGLFPLGVLYGQVTRTAWAWPASILVGAVLFVWIAMEVYLIGYRSPLQPAYAVLAAFIVAVCYAPSVRAYFQAG